MPDPSPDDEGLHLVRRDEPASSHSSPVNPQRCGDSRHQEQGPELFIFLTRGRVIAVAATALLIVFLIWGSGYVIREGHRQIAAIQPTPALAIESQLPSPVSVTANMLHVSSIVLGNPRLAVVNAKTLMEGDSLEVKMGTGSAVLHVIRIEDGLVRFKNGNQTIDVRLPAPLTGHTSPN